MSDGSEPARHQQLERQFIAHVEHLLDDPRLQLDTARGPKAVHALSREINHFNGGVQLKQLMIEMGKPDRQLESQMPRGEGIEVGLSHKKFGIMKSWIGRFRAVCIPPWRALIAGQPPAPASAAELAQTLASMPPPLTGIPSTLAVMSTSGFTDDAKRAAQRMTDCTVILVWPNETGGFSVCAPPNAANFADLLDPEPDLQKRKRIRDDIESNRILLLSSGIAADQLAARLQLSPQLVESELKSYAREYPGLAAKRLDGRWVLFREGSAPPATGSASGGADMPFIDRIKTLFSRKGDVEKKIALLSERRTALSQQLDRGYEEMSALENREAQLRTQFKDATSDLPRRRITGQLLQLRKDIERRQQLLSVLNQQINVVSTHLHNLELQRQGKSASLPSGDEIAADAQAAEEVLAELQAGSELAESVSAPLHGGMSDEEQALYDQLLTETKQQAPAPAAPAAPEPPAKPQAQPAAPAPERQRNQPEPG